MVTALFSGSFDPLTLGHIEIIKSALKIFGKVVVAIGINAEKQALFALEERRAMLIEALSEYNVEIISFTNLLADFAKKNENPVLIRGIRDASDIDYEIRMARMNSLLNETLETIFIPIKPEYSAISSSLVKQIASMGGDIAQFVPQTVAKALHNKYET